MVNENIAMYKSKRFAIRIVNMYKYLCSEKKEYILSKQVLRSGTSIGANIAEAECEKTKVLTETRQRYIQLQEEADMIEIQIMRSIAPAVITSNDYDIIMDALIHNIDRRMISEKYNVSYNRVAHKISNALQCTII